MDGLSRSRGWDKEIQHGVLLMEQLVLSDKWARNCNRLRPSVRPSIRPSVHPSVRLSVMRSPPKPLDEVQPLVCELLT